MEFVNFGANCVYVDILMLRYALWISNVIDPLKVRSAGSTDGDKTEGTDDENIELEKSNILLMGPTGSGN